MFRLLKAGVLTGTGAIAVITTLVGSNLWTYNRLAYEEPVATISFNEIAEQKYLARLVLEDGTSSNYEVSGDEWRMEVRMLKWKTWLSLLGKDPMYQLDRLSGRYSSVTDARSKPHSAHELRDEDAVIDLWTWLNRNASDVWGMDASYGASVFLPMKDNASYQIQLSHTGLFARRID